MTLTDDDHNLNRGLRIVKEKLPEGRLCLLPETIVTFVTDSLLADCGWILTGCAMIPVPICFIHAITQSPHSGLLNVSNAAPPLWIIHHV